MTRLRSAVDYVDLMQRDDVDHLLALLQLPFRTLHEPRRRPCATTKPFNRADQAGRSQTVNMVCKRPCFYRC